MAGKPRSAAVAVGVALASRLPISWLRLLNQTLYRTVIGRKALSVVWAVFAEAAVTIPRGPLAGVRFATGGGQPEYLLGASEPAVQEMLVACVDSKTVLYDVGANVGFFTLLAARLASGGGHVYAFEPIEVNRRALQKNIDLNDMRNVEVHQLAISDTAGTVQMSIGNDQATGHLTDSGDDLLTVRSTTIDAFVADGHRPPTVVKVDVEGAEDLVLAGMRETLREYRPLVVCEIHYEAADLRHSKLKAILEDSAYIELSVAGGSMPHILAVPDELCDEVSRRLGRRHLLANVC